MSDFLIACWRWWQGGDLLMPVMLAVALVLYGLIGERIWSLWRIGSVHRRDELLALLERSHTGEADAAWRTWAAQYVGLAEQVELSRGLGLIRVLTTCLPLLGLLGTVTGMVHTFAHLDAGADAAGRFAVAREASAGIGLALTATQYGMALAIPALVADWLLRRRIAMLVDQRQRIALGAIAAPQPALELQIAAAP
ncbi:hypothetical protein LBMAG53_16500 [Planctomycetota bacterium]|nr:hypothetical protein LBMAG53_16500 [Planctomycetota bacterium]